MAYSDEEQLEDLRNAVHDGDQALKFKESEAWRWFNEKVLKEMFNDAVKSLITSATDEHRVKAQQMMLASKKPEGVLDHMIDMGRASQIQILEFSHQQQEAENNG